MLKIAPNPDAAYEICTIFALDCRSLPKHNSSSIDTRNYELSEMRFTPDHYNSSSSRMLSGQTSRTSTFSGGNFSLNEISHRESNRNLNVATHYDGSANFSISNHTFKRHDKHANVIEESGDDYEEEYEEDSDENNNGNFYLSPPGAKHATYILPSFTETFHRNQTTVRLKQFHIYRIIN